MRGVDGQAGGLAQNQHREGRRSAVRDDQKVRPGVSAADGHYVLVYPPPTVQVQVRLALQRRPVDVDVNDRSQTGDQDRNQLRQFSGNQRRARPPRSIDIVPQRGRQSDPHRAGGARDGGCRRRGVPGRRDHRIRAIHGTTLRIPGRSAGASRRPGSRAARDLVSGQRNNSPLLRYATCTNCGRLR